MQTADGANAAQEAGDGDIGDGTRGTFRVRLSFTPQGGAGRLAAYEISMADGSRSNIVVIPLTIAQ